MSSGEGPGQTRSREVSSGGAWEQLTSADRFEVADLRTARIPPTPGVYGWFREGECVYVGKAIDLRSRLSSHRSRSLDLSRSTLRASVAVQELGLTRSTARQRPTVMTPAQVAVVNEWLAKCQVAWLSCADATEAGDLEGRLRAEHLPRLNMI